MKENSSTRKAVKAKKKTSVQPVRDCCESKDIQHPDHSEHISRLNRAQGQIEGIERMIRERRYCVDILIQFRAAMAALRSVELAVFETHLRHCVRSTMKSNDEKLIETKIHELTELLTRRSTI